MSLGKYVTYEEARLALLCETYDEFEKKYAEQFIGNTTITASEYNRLVKRGHNLYHRRETYVLKVGKMQIAKSQEDALAKKRVEEAAAAAKLRSDSETVAARTVLIPAVIRHKATSTLAADGGDNRSHSVEDPDAVLARQSNLLAEILIVAKENVGINKEIRNLLKEQIDLFRRIDNRQSVKVVS
jgi:hypothetical protein